MKKYILTSIMLLVLFGQAYFFGVNDWIVVGFILLTAAFLYVSIIKLHSGNRKMLRVNAKPNSWLYNLLSRDTTIIMRIVAAFSSLILGTILVVLIKGMVLQQGYWPFFVTIVISSLLLYSFVNKDVNSEFIDNNIHVDITQHGNNLARIFYAAIILNLMLSFAFSAYDTFEIKTSDINFSNFTDKAVEASFEKTEFNQYSRIFINAYLLMDYIKVALAKMFVDLFKLKDNFYGFYIVIFALNVFKLFAFSFSFVLLQKGFDGTANFLMPILKRFGVYIEKTVNFLIPILKSSISRIGKFTTSKSKSLYVFLISLTRKNNEKENEEF